MSGTAPAAGARGLVPILGALTAIAPLTVDMYLPAFPALVADLRASDAQVQLTLAGTMVGMAAGQLVVGPLSDRWGRRRPLLVGVVAHVLTSLVCALAPTIEVLVAARLAQGLSGSTLAVLSVAMVGDLYEGARAAQVFSRLMLVVGLAPVLAPSLGGLVLRWTSWRGIFVVVALVTAVVAVVAARGLPETRQADPDGGATGVVRGAAVVLRDPVFVCLTVAAGLTFATMFGYVAGAPFALQVDYGLTEQEFALVFGANAVGLVLATQLNALLLRWASPLRMLLLGSVLGACGALGLGAVAWVGTTVWPVLGTLAVVVASLGFVMPNAPALALSRHRALAGTGAAVLGALRFGIAAVAIPLVGLGPDGGLRPMALVMVGTALSALVLVLCSSTVSRRRREAAPTGGEDDEANASL